MTQVTWRAPDDVVERVRKAAARDGRSVNEYLTLIARAATDPDLADSEVQRIRERLEQADLLVPAGAPRSRPDASAVARARRRAGHGTPLSELVVDGRDG